MKAKRRRFRSAKCEMANGWAPSPLRGRARLIDRAAPSAHHGIRRKRWRIRAQLVGPTRRGAGSTPTPKCHVSRMQADVIGRVWGRGQRARRESVPRIRSRSGDGSSHYSRWFSSGRRARVWVFMPR
ncbi:hypothetical protein GY45DRAFT_47596 [Cubamyces sp. BRFM 1775]|nr:hypothetical protein GY45DRAFT_47596 [Cubamyces sp. BRFM 1775]